MVCMASLHRAKEDALRKSKANLELNATHTSSEDLDAPLSDPALKGVWDAFSAASGELVLPPRLRPSNQLVSRLYRELMKYVFSLHPLSKALNAYTTSLTPASSQRKAAVGHVEFSTGHLNLPEVPLAGVIDCLNRLDLLYWAYLIIGWPRSHTDTEGRTTKWFTLTAMFAHLDFLKTKLLNGSIVSLQDFLTRELEVRARAFELVQGELKLSLSNAFQVSREKGADIWVNLYRNQEGVGAQSPLYLNPLLALADHENASKRQKLGVPILGGTIFPLNNGNTSRNTTSRGKTVCEILANGTGCSAGTSCPDLHICHILIRKQGGKFCGGRHSRSGCPHN